MLDWRWDVDDDLEIAAFEITTSRVDEHIGQEVASEFARALDAAGIRTVTTMLRTRFEGQRVTLLWTGEISDPRRTRSIFSTYERALSADVPTALG